MTKFRLTIGENGTAFGKQQVLKTGEAENAVEFVKKAIHGYAPDDILCILQNAWVDAGKGTIPLAVCAIKRELILS